MNKKILLTVFGLIFLLSFIPQASAFEWCEWIPFWQCQDDTTTNVLTATEKWVVDYSTDEDFFLWIEDPKVKKTEVCLLSETATKLNDLEIHKNLWNKNGELIIQMNRKKKTIDEVDYYGFCRKIDNDEVDWIKFGDHSTVVEYVNDVLEVVDENGTAVQDVTLDYNTDQCLINCKAGGHSVLYSNGTLFDAFDFVDTSNNSVQLSGANIYILEEGYEYNISEEIFEDSCTTEQWEEENITNSSIYGCTLNSPTGIFEDVTYQLKDSWKEYNFEILPAGTYNWEIRGKKNDLSSIDWAVAFGGFETDTIRQYWAWWDSDWDYYKEISNITGEFFIINLTRDSGLTSWGDTRFIDPEPNNYTLITEGDGLAYGDFDAGLSTGLLAYYKMDETTGTTLADEVSSYDITTSTTGMVGSTGKIINSVSFDGTNNAVLPSRVGDADNAMSVSFWVKGTASGWNIFQRGTDTGDWAILVNTNDFRFDKWVSGINTEGYRSPTLEKDLLDDEWHFIAVTKPTGIQQDMNLYVDGDVWTIPYTGSLVGGSTGYVLGSRGDGSALFTGDMDELAIWSRELTQEEMYEVYNEQKESFIQDAELNYTFRDLQDDYAYVTVDTNFESGQHLTAQGLSYDEFDAGLQTDLISYWDFEETSGDLLDQHGSYDGTVSGAGRGIYGKIDNAYQLGGTDYIEFGDVADFEFTTTQEMTFNTWVRFIDFSSHHGLFSKREASEQNGAYSLSPVSSALGNELFWSMYTGSGSSQTLKTVGAGLETEKWYMISLTMDANNDEGIIYVNGKRVADNGQVITNNFASTTHPFFLAAQGQGAGSIGQQLRGRMDETGIWDRILDEDEIAELYNTTASKSQVDWYYGNALATTTASASDVFYETTNGVYYFDGTLTDSANGYNATNINSATSSAGYIDTAYDFDGVNQYMTLPSDTYLDETESFTVSLWANSDSSTNGILFGNGAELRIGYMSSGNIGFQIFDGVTVATVSSPFTSNQWHHVAVTFDSLAGNTVLYVDGEAKGRDDFTGDISVSEATVGSEGVSEYFDGTVDELTIIDKALSPTEVYDMYVMNNQTSYAIIGARRTESLLTITANAPEDNLVTNNGTITFNCSSTDAGGTSEVILYINSSWIDHVTGSGNTNLTLISTQTLSDGYWEWYCSVDGDELSTETRNITVDSTAPNVTIIAPSGLVNFITVGDNLTLEYSVTNLSGGESCWYTYSNATKNFINCSETELNFTYILGGNSISVFANDTVGNIDSDTTSWIVGGSQAFQEYNEITIETAYETFLIGVEINDTVWDSVSAVLNYNGTEYTAVQIGQGSTVNFTSRLDIPLSNGVDVNNTFFWNITLTNDEGDFYSSSSEQIQQVLAIVFENCNYSDGPVFYFETFDILTPENNVNATFSSSWRIKADSGISSTVAKSFEDTAEDRSNWSFCISPNSSNYTVSVSIVVDATDYTPTTHYIVDTDYTSVTQNISLYLLNNSEATLTEVYLKNSDNVAVNGAYISVQRYDVGTDTYYNYGTLKTDSSGTDLIYLKWYDDWYKFIAYVNDEIVAEDGPKKVSSSPVTLTTGTGRVYNYDDFDSIAYSLVFNEVTDNFVLTYLDTEGVSSSACLNVIHRDVLADTTICDSCATSSSATLYCNIAGAENGTYIARFYVTGSPRNYLAVLYWYVNAQNQLYEMIGNDNGTGLAIITAGIVLSMFLISPAIGILGAIAGMALSIILGFQPLDTVSFAGIVVVGLLIMWAVKK